MKSRLLDKGIDLTCGDISLIDIDITDQNSVKSLFKKLESLSGVVNCAYPRNKNYGRSLLDVKIDDFNENVSLNLGSSFLLMQQCAAYFQQNKEPFSLVNISSIYGLVAPNFSIYEGTKMTMPVEYAAIKSGLNHMSKYVAKYVNDSRFRVNVVSPGGLLDGQPSSFLDAYKSQTFGKGMLNAVDIIGTIIFLLSSVSEYVNGQNIVVDDGFSI
jgi:NAD(P)-dependent dehydrogenase (short-subunit alcohol dehydrogenase family)